MGRAASARRALSVVVSFERTRTLRLGRDSPPGARRPTARKTGIEGSDRIAPQPHRRITDRRSRVVLNLQTAHWSPARTTFVHLFIHRVENCGHSRLASYMC